MTIPFDHSVVCRLVMMTRDGRRFHADLTRRGDPVAALDKLFRRGTIAVTDITDMRCEPRDPHALTSRAAEASAATIRFLAVLPETKKKSFRRSRFH